MYPEWDIDGTVFRKIYTHIFNNYKSVTDFIHEIYENTIHLLDDPSEFNNKICTTLDDDGNIIAYKCTPELPGYSMDDILHRYIQEYYSDRLINETNKRLLPKVATVSKNKDDDPKIEWVTAKEMKEILDKHHITYRRLCEYMDDFGRKVFNDSGIIIDPRLTDFILTDRGVYMQFRPFGRYIVENTNDDKPPSKAVALDQLLKEYNQ